MYLEQSVTRPPSPCPPADKKKPAGWRKVEKTQPSHPYDTCVREFVRTHWTQTEPHKKLLFSVINTMPLSLSLHGRNCSRSRRVSYNNSLMTFWLFSPWTDWVGRWSFCSLAAAARAKTDFVNMATLLSQLLPWYQKWCLGIEVTDSLIMLRVAEMGQFLNKDCKYLVHI